MTAAIPIAPPIEVYVSSIGNEWYGGPECTPAPVLLVGVFFDELGQALPVVLDEGRPTVLHDSTTVAGLELVADWVGAERARAAAASVQR